jgi:hypothetical protein
LNQSLLYINWFLYRFMLLITFLSAVCFASLLIFGWGNHTVIYWLAMAETRISQLAPPLVIAASVYFLLTLILVRKPADGLVRSSAASIVLLSLFASLFLCGTIFTPIWQTGPLGYREHMVTEHLSEYTYHLQFFSSDFAEAYTHRYDLYECQFNLFCKQIYTVMKSNGGITPDVESIELVPDSVTNTLSLQVNGSTVFTVPS